MDSSIYIPKWLIAGFVAAVGCVVGWLLGAADLVTASIASPEPETDSDPPVVAVAAPDEAQTTSVADSAVEAAATAAAPPPVVAVQGVASTTTTSVRISSTPEGHVGEAVTPNSTVRINAVTGAPIAAGPAASTVAAAPAPTSAPATATAPAPTSAPATAAPAPTSAPATAAPAPTSAPATAAPAATSAPAPASAPVMPASSVAAGAPMGAPAGAPTMSFPMPAQPQMTMPVSWPVTGIGSWGPPEPLPPLVSPPLFAANLWNPLPGATSRGVAFSEWESYRTDVAGRNILVTTDDSNFFRDRNGLINANTGDIDASGLNVIDASDSVIRGSESADEAPWQTMAAALVDLAGGDGTTAPGNGDDDDDDDDDDEDADELNEAPEPNGDVPPGTPPPIGSQPSSPTSPTSPTSPAPGSGATAAVIPPGYVWGSDDDDNGGDGFDFPYTEWVEHASADHATAVHTDEGTTLASGSDAIVIGADGYDDDDNRAVGENIVITRDDGNVVVGGTGQVNAQIGDAEQGVLVMDVDRTFIQGGGAY